MRRAFVAAVVVLSVVLAGCAAVPFETAETASPTPAPPVTVEGELPFDAETVYRRVADLHGESLSTLPSVTVIVDDSADGGVSDRYHVTRFQRLLGLEPELRGTSLAGLARGDEVRLFTDAVESDASLERVLAHEFAHVVQFHRGAFGEVSEQVRGMGANESRLQTAVTEGAASYVERRYAERYLDEGGEPDDWRTVRSGRTQFGASVLAPYHFGERYVAERVDSPAELADVYEDPPRTSEQLVHGYAPDEQLPSSLFVRFDARDGWAKVDARTKGELFVRLILEGQLPVERAADAAAGWENDQLAVLERGDDRAYVWALRWDSPADADEFEAAVRTFLDGHANATAEGWRDGESAFDVVRASDDTVVVFAGDPGFVVGATAVAAAETVTVSAGGDAAVAPGNRRASATPSPR